MKKSIKALIATATLAATAGLGVAQYNIMNPEPVTQSYMPMSPSQEYTSASEPAPEETFGYKGYKAEVKPNGSVIWYDSEGIVSWDEEVPFDVQMSYPFTEQEKADIQWKKDEEYRLWKIEQEHAKRKAERQLEGYNY